MLSLTGVDRDNSIARRANHPAFDANAAGSWFPSTGKAVACSFAARCLVVNIPIDLLCYREVCGSAERNADSLIGRILSSHDDESGGPHHPKKCEQALAIAALINLLVDREHVGNGRPSNPYQEAVHREKHTSLIDIKVCTASTLCYFPLLVHLNSSIPPPHTYIRMVDSNLDLVLRTTYM